MTNGEEPFFFYTERRLVLLTGLKARNLDELLEHLKHVSGSSIFYHTHHQFLSHHFETPVFHNEFANWVSRSLQLERLAEELTAVDLMALTSVRQIREAIIERIESHLKLAPAARDCLPGDEFHFCESQSFVMRTGLVAYDLPSFFASLEQVSTASLFFHFFEARLRLGGPTNDFSLWLRDRGHEPLAEAIDRLDPYIMTLDELRRETVEIGRKQGVV